MNKIICLMLIFILLISTVACGQKEEAVATPILVETNPNFALPKSNPSDNWRDFEVKVNNTVITLPISYEDFAQQTRIGNENDSKMLDLVEPDSLTEIKVQVNASSDATATLELYNPSQYKIPLNKCIIIGIVDSNLHYSDPTEITFPNGIRVGERIECHILARLGNPDRVLGEFKTYTMEDYNKIQEYKISNIGDSYFSVNIKNNKVMSCNLRITPNDKDFILK